VTRAPLADLRRIALCGYDNAELEEPAAERIVVSPRPSSS
jgi:hypothetical protein